MSVSGFALPSSQGSAASQPVDSASRWSTSKTIEHEHTRLPNASVGVHSVEQADYLHPSRSVLHIKPTSFFSKRTEPTLGLPTTVGNADGQQFSSLLTSRTNCVARKDDAGNDEDSGASAMEIKLTESFGRQDFEQLREAQATPPVKSPISVTMLPKDWTHYRSPRGEHAIKFSIEAVKEARKPTGKFLDNNFDWTVNRDRCEDATRSSTKLEPNKEPQFSAGDWRPSFASINAVLQQSRTPRTKTGMSSPRKVPLSPISQPWGMVEEMTPRSSVKGFELNSGPTPPFSPRIAKLILDECIPSKPLLEPLRRLRLRVPKENQAVVSTLNNGMFRPSIEFQRVNPAGLYTLRVSPPGRRR